MVKKQLSEQAKSALWRTAIENELQVLGDKGALTILGILKGREKVSQVLCKDQFYQSM